MAYTFKNVVSPMDLNNSILQHFGAQLSSEEQKRLSLIKRFWNFWEGFHWEEIPDTGKPQVTLNFARAFTNKMIAFELGKGFKTRMKPEIEAIDGDNDPLEFINAVWEQNKKGQFCTEFGQSKAITGDGWVQVIWEPKFINGKRNEAFDDPFDLFENGRIRIIVVPTSVCFPEYNDGWDKDKMTKFTVMYPITRRQERLLIGSKTETIMYRQVWTDTRLEIWQGKEKITDIPNRYGNIPFFQTKNIPVAGKTQGQSDLEDIIPINMEINLKKSDVSEIIDYHSAPITVVFGARIGQLDRGANKVWGGLPKDAKIENLKLDGDLVAANEYINSLKTALHEIANVPVGALGGDLHISNTSALALQIALMPLLERIDEKQKSSAEGIKRINQMILKIALQEGLLTIPEGVKRQDYFWNEVKFQTPLPKDVAFELQQIESEMALGLEDRRGAMERLDKENIEHKINKIDEDRKKNPTIYGLDPATGLPIASAKKIGQNADGNPKETNAGYTNGPTPKQNPNSK
jgi:hypothetical protein